MDDKVKVTCPLCLVVGEISRKKIKKGIAGVKCSPCFKERSIFVNLELTRFESNKGEQSG